MKMSQRNVTRRSFVAGAATVAGLGLVACGPAPDSESEGEQAATQEDAQATTAGDGVLRIGSEIAFPPYEWMTDTETEYTAPVDGGGYVDGFDVALAKMIAEALDKDLLFVNMSFGGLIDALNVGTVDIVLSGMGDTEERAQAVAFSHSYYDSIYGLMVKGDSSYASAKELEDFAGAAVLGQKSSPLDFVIDQIPNVNHLTPVEHVPDMFSQLNAGACDAVTVAVETADTYLATYPDLVLIVPENPRLDPGFTGTCAALRKDDTATLEVVNQVIDGLSKEELQALYEQAQARQPE